MTPIRCKIVRLFSLVASFLLSAQCCAEPATPVSVVDYLKSVDSDSSFAYRKKLYVDQWVNEDYKGTVEQNVKLLKHLLSLHKRMLIPFPSSSIDGCAEFYRNPEVAKFLTSAFSNNAVNACIVTGTQTPQNEIRKKLQEIYRSKSPADGKVFTPEEHKAIHDAAYKAAGCEEDSAKLWGWYVVDKVSLPQHVVSLAIEKFGPCTITGD